MKNKWIAVKTKDDKFEVRRKTGKKYETICDCYCTNDYDAMHNAETIALMLNVNQILNA